MSRRAVLIGCPQSPPTSPLLGTEVDVDRYITFLTSKIGGAWSVREIVSLIDPTKEDVETAIQDAANVDYAFVLFSGHGYHPKGSNDPLSTVVRFSSGRMEARALNPGNPRCTVIVDACREITHMTKEAADFITEHTRIATRLPDRTDYRRVFDEVVARCPEQTVYMFGCSIGEVAQDDEKLGGLFPRTILSKAIDWEDRYEGANTPLKVSDVFFRASITVAANSKQTPRFHRTAKEGSRQFPFVIHLT